MIASCTKWEKQRYAVYNFKDFDNCISTISIKENFQRTNKFKYNVHYKGCIEFNLLVTIIPFNFKLIKLLNKYICIPKVSMFFKFVRY